MRKILVTIPMEEEHKKYIQEIAVDAEVIYSERPDKVLIQEAEIILGNVPVDIIKDSKNLKWIQLNSAGANNYTEKMSEGVLLTNASGAYGVAIAEHMLGMLLAVQKKLHLYAANQKAHQWKDEGNVTSIYGSKTLVVGLGDIGGEFAKRMYALGSRVCGIKRNMTEVPEYMENIYPMEKLEELLPQFDIVALSLPETNATRGLFDKNKFEKMKKNAILLNVGRGTTVNTADLYEALNNEIIGGAGLDVTDIEPLPSESPLWDAKNLVLTPHVSGGYHLNETLERIRKIALTNLKAYYEGRPLINMVDFSTGYRKFVTKDVLK